MIRLIACVMIAGLAAIIAPSRACAQYPYGPYGYGGYGYGYPIGAGQGIGYGATLSGYADLTQANASAMQTNEQSRMTREKTKQERINTKKMAFDEMLYEQANTPTYLETLTKDQAQILTRMMKYPTPTEISDGKTLNVMLPNLQSLAAHGAQGPPVPIAQQYLGMLNLTGGSAGASTGGSVGMLRDGGQVEWPPALVGPHQEKLDILLPKAYKATLAGKLDEKLLRQIRTEMRAMRESLRQQLARDEIESSSYMRAIEFYNALDSSVKALERPDARRQLDGTYAARGRNVQELADYMSENGLRFAPATPGSENAYQSVHDAFVRYTRSVEGFAGTQTSRLSNLPQGINKK